MASNVTSSNFTFFSTTTDDDFYESTVFITSTTEYGSELFGINITGLELMIFYIALNVIILFIILILACRSGAKKAKEEKEKKRNLRKQREEQHIEQVNNDNVGKQFEIQLSIQRGDRGNSVHSEPPSEHSERKEDILENLHDRVSSFGRVSSAKVCCGACVADIMNRSFIYSAFLVHVWDQGSDLGVIYTWFTEDNGRWEYLGWIAIGILINYRLFSAYSLRKAQRGWRDTILQILDFQLFVDVFRSFEDVKPTDSLYWIRAMEAVLESCLQILLQFVYLYQETDILVWLSLFGSMASVIFSLLHYTDVIFVFEDPDDAVTTCESIWINLKWYIGYISRFLFRLCEVTSRCMVLALIWSTWNSEDHSDLTGSYIVGCIIGLELIFYTFLTQFRIPPWEVAAFLVVNVDLTLTFEGRVGALTKPLRRNPFYRCVCKPVAEMFTAVTDETEQYYDEDHLRTSTHSNQKHKQLQPWAGKNVKHQRELDPERQKLLIAPAHYVYRFLESIFQLFCVLTYAVIDNDIYIRLFKNNTWTVAIATATTILTPILYCTVRSFADESKTLERNLIAMVHHETETREIIKLIGAGASLHQTDYEGNNIVHACVVKNNDQLLRRLIKKYKKNRKSVRMNEANKKGYTPVLLAAKCGSIDCLKLLIDHIDFNQRLNKNGQAMIHIATEYDQHELIEYLCSLEDEDKCSIHATYTYITPNRNEIINYNAIHVAARHNSVLSLDILLSKGVDFRAVLGNGDTAAIIAASRGHTIILQKLYDHHDVFDIQGNFGHTPLYRAALNNHPGTVLVLGRDFHADPNILDENNVHIVMQAFKSTNFGVLSALAELGCRFDGTGNWLEVEIQKKGDDDDKLTPLMWACKYNYPKLVKTLLDSGADKNHMNKLDETASHHAAAMGSLDCIKLLHRYNANLNILNGAGLSPKEKAIEQNQKHVIQWFNALEKHNR